MADQLVTFNITSQLGSVSQAGYGVPLFITDVAGTGAATNFVDTGLDTRVGIYYSVDEMIDAGFSETDNAYIAGLGFMSAQVKPEYFVIGRWDASDSETITEAYSAIKNEFDNFYFVTCESHVKADIIALAAIVGTEYREYGYSTEEVGAYNTTLSAALAGTPDTSAALVDAGTARVFGVYHQDADATFPECAFIGVGAAYSPDETNASWGNQIITGVTASVQTGGLPLTGAQRTNLEARNLSYVVNGTFYPTVAPTNSNIIIGGANSNGEWIDEVRTNDCIRSRCTESLTLLMISQTGTRLKGGSAGRAAIAGAISGALNSFVTAGSIDDYTVVTENSVFNAATRTLTDVEVTYTHSGAIYKIVVDAIAKAQGE